MVAWIVAGSRGPTPGAWVQSCSLGPGTQLQGTLEMADGATTVTREVRKGLQRRVPLKHPATPGGACTLKRLELEALLPLRPLNGPSDAFGGPSTEVGGDPSDVRLSNMTIRATLVGAIPGNRN